jgi:hypothetical protein
MPNVLFIDANAYLELFGTAQGKRLLAALNEQRESMFITQQIVNEVERNKLRVAAAFFDDNLKKVKREAIGIPDHAFDSGTTKDLRKRQEEVNQKIQDFNKLLGETVVMVLEQISRSEDEISKALQAVFGRAVAHNKDQLDRARERKEFGKPPGKSRDPLGDQLSWEQLRDHLTDGSRLWLISKDFDYVTLYDTQAFLNPALRRELKNVNVACFSTLSEGISDFATKTGAGKEELPNSTVLEEIKKEEESLPPYWLSDEMTINNSAHRLTRMAAAILTTTGMSIIDPKALEQGPKE